VRLDNLEKPAATLVGALDQLASAATDFVAAYDAIAPSGRVDEFDAAAAARTVEFDHALLLAGVLHGRAMIVHQRTYES
jgi:hypothetical protein